MQRERDQFTSLGAYRKTTIDEAIRHGGRIIPMRWVMIRKPDGSVRSRLVVQEVARGPCDFAFASTPSSLGPRIGAHIALANNFEIVFFDIRTAFAHAPIPEEEGFLWVRPPPSEQPPEGNVVWQALHALPGFRKAPRWFQLWFRDKAMSLGYRSLTADPQIFYNDELNSLMIVHVDDVMLVIEKGEIERVANGLKDFVELKPGILLEQSWEKYLGIEWRRPERGVIELRIPGHTYERLLDIYSMKKCNPLHTLMSTGATAGD